MFRLEGPGNGRNFMFAATAAQGASLGARGETPKPVILIVSDQKSISDILVLLLSAGQYEVISVLEQDNPEEALNKAFGVLDVRKVSLIFSNIGVKSGMEFAGRRDPKIPFIFITSKIEQVKAASNEKNLNVTWYIPKAPNTDFTVVMDLANDLLNSSES